MGFQVCQENNCDRLQHQRNKRCHYLLVQPDFKAFAYVLRLMSVRSHHYLLVQADLKAIAHA
ncbi:hypothetical protein [Nostoc sp.]|uniref:hypothetical protein n=1 Tax=Nostoc sp. TaxID=1180 RepID=UPI002FFAF64A